MLVSERDRLDQAEFRLPESPSLMRRTEDSRPAQVRDKLRTDSSANKPRERAIQSLVEVFPEASVVESVQDSEADWEADSADTVQDSEVDSEGNKN